MTFIRNKTATTTITHASCKTRYVQIKHWFAHCRGNTATRSTKQKIRHWRPVRPTNSGHRCGGNVGNDANICEIKQHCHSVKKCWWGRETLMKSQIDDKQPMWTPPTDRGHRCGEDVGDGSLRPPDDKRVAVPCGAGRPSLLSAPSKPEANSVSVMSVLDGEKYVCPQENI